MKGFILLLLTFFIIPAQAGIVIYGTRVIYPAGKNEVMVQLMNRGDRGALVQAWIDDSNTSITPENIRVPFLISPPVVRVRANTGQQLKIKALSNTLPRNQESLFYLNVLDIPPNASVNDGKKCGEVCNTKPDQAVLSPGRCHWRYAGQFSSFSPAAKRQKLVPTK